ncbi:unnamed protein product [Parnassius apollo]|uniref:(apollo) hypothetical protein n=1 Tax=Parnassius apollo TaxID=110799 RepID=A0A8S3WMZ0_PARAO|nr:unnamed protein product [Parnassius apollo]
MKMEIIYTRTKQANTTRIQSKNVMMCGDPETQDHVSESSEDQQMDVDSSDSDDNEPLIHISSQNFYFVKKKDKSGHYKTICKWRKTPYPQGIRTRRQNIVTEQPGPQGTARAVSNPFESWLLFLDVDMLQHIVECTNIKIASMQTNYERQRDCEETNIIELKALIGIMYLIGIHKSSHALIDDIWMADGTGYIFKASEVIGTDSLVIVATINSGMNISRAANHSKVNSSSAYRFPGGCDHQEKRLAIALGRWLSIAPDAIDSHRSTDMAVNVKTPAATVIPKNKSHY